MSRTANIVIGILAITIIIMGYFMWKCYNDVASHKKEKEVYLMNKENELNSREKQVADKETCDRELTKCKGMMSSIKDMITMN